MSLTVKNIKRYLLICVAFICILLGLIGIVLPLLPTTPFFILALTCFARSSKRFHQQLLNSPYIGPILAAWEADKRIDKQRKKQIMLIIVCSFAVSIWLLQTRFYLQLLLIAIMFILLFFIKRIAEK
jgi:uncharacterized membrane protein YbaN (DUF454 family)